MTARLLIIGLDGADGRTLDRASRNGALPNLTALRNRGVAWGLTSPRGATDDALWASFQYGAGVGAHGRYTYNVQAPDGQVRFAVLREADRRAFWDDLSDRGNRVAVFDVPKCRTPRPLNGIHLVDWLTHGRYFSAPRGYPAGFAEATVARFGAAPPSRCDYAHPAPLSDDDIAAVRGHLLASADQKSAAALHHLSTEAWDLFIVGFKEAHCASHMFWDLADAGHAGHDAARVARIGDPVADILRKLDVAVGDLVTAAGPDATVIVFSTTDFAANGSILHLMPGLVDRLNRHIADPDARLVRLLRRIAGRPPAPPPCQSVFYSDNAGALRVPRRRGESDDQYAGRLDLIATMASELVDADDGLPVVAAITRPAFEQDGEQAASLPHLLLHFRANTCPRVVVSSRLGRIEAPPPENIRTGNHEAGGFAIAAGPSSATAMSDVATMSDFAALANKALAMRSHAASR